MEPIKTEQVERLKACVPALLQWYAENRRPLPFRENVTAYRVWVSEIMLQQTRIEAALPHFERFIRELPTVKDLATADEDKLMKLWEGLGYYSRARNLQKAARQVMEQFGGVLPADYGKLLSLCGVGEYTAGAIASIAYGIPVPAVDGNVLRVFSRLLCCEEDVMLPPVRGELRRVAGTVIPEDAPGAFNEAVMELGETLCLPNTEPRCGECPVAGWCEAKKAGRQAQLPVRRVKTKRRLEERTVLVITTDEPEPRVLLRRRKGSGLLAGMWELPNAEGRLSPDEAAQAFDLVPLHAEELPEGKHVFSHVEWKLFGVRVVTDAFEPPADCVFVTLRELRRDYALPSAFRTYTKLLPSLMEGDGQTRLAGV